MNERVFQLFWERDGDFQELGHCSLFDLHGQSWNCHGTCVCNLACWYVTISIYSEAQGLMEVESSAILDLFSSNQFMPCPWAMSFFFFFYVILSKVMPSLLFHSHIPLLSDVVSHPVPQKSPNVNSPHIQSAAWFCPLSSASYLLTYLLSMYLINLFDLSNLSNYPLIFLYISSSALSSGLV